jgi:hypothetical protein
MPATLDGEVLRITEPPAIPKAQEDIIPFTISAPYMLKTLWIEFAPAFLKTAPEVHWAGATIDFSQTESYQTHVRLVTIPPAAASRLISACRAHVTTLTPLFNAMVIFSLCRRLPADGAASFAFGTPMTMRPWVDSALAPDIENTMLDLVGPHRDVASRELCARVREQFATGAPSSNPDALFWEYVTELTDALKSTKKRLPADDIMGMMAWISDFRDWFRKKDGKPRDWAFEVSNIGILDGQSAAPGGWAVNRGLFTQSAHIAGAAFCANVIGMAGGPITITVTWGEGVVDTVLAEGIAEDLEKWTTQAGAEGGLKIIPVRSD